MFLRKENIEDALDGSCVNCDTADPIELEMWAHSSIEYTVGRCKSCNYEIIIEKRLW